MRPRNIVGAEMWNLCGWGLWCLLVGPSAPGESVVYLTSWENRFDNMREAAVAAFVEMWAPLDGVQIGVVTFGGGLGGQGDAVNIFGANTSVANTIDREEHLGPTTEASFVAEADGSWFARVAQVGVLGARRRNLPDDDMGAPPPVGSPGIVVPEPSAITMCAGLCLGCLICSRKKFARDSHANGTCCR